MIGDAAFNISPGDACQTKGMWFAKTYAARGIRPSVDIADLGSTPPDMTRLGTLTSRVLEQIRKSDREKLIGYAVLKMCNTKHNMRLELQGNFVFADPRAARIPVRYLTSIDADGICVAHVDYQGAGQLDNCVDFPAPRSVRKQTNGLVAVEAASSEPMARAHIILRPSLHQMTGEDLAL